MILRKLMLAILIAMSCLVAGCDKDDAALRPSKIVSGIENNQIDLKEGESKLFSPLFVADESLVYQWLLDGKNVSDSKSYTFKSDKYGRYSLKFEILNKNWVQSVEYAIRVVGISELESDVENNAVILNLGESKVLKPIFEGEGDLTYSWILNNKEVSEEKEYTFEGTDAGKFNLKFELTQGDQTKSLEYNIKVDGTYSNGVFIVNEGWFGHENGNVNFWDRVSDDIQHKVYTKENPDKTLGVTTQYACINDSKLFLVSKSPDHLVVVNSATLKEMGRVALSGSEQARAFAYNNETSGFLSSSDGIYQVDLSSYTLGEKVTGVAGEVGNMIVLNDKLFALRSRELIVIDIASLTIEKTFDLANNAGGLIKDKDNMVWVGSGSQLLKVNSNDLSSETIDLTDGTSVNSSFGWAWNAGSLTYSKENHSLYFVSGGGWSPKSVGRYNIGTKSAEKLFDIDSDYMIYGAGTYVDPVSNKLYVTAIKGFGQAANFNRLYVYDLDGTKEKVLDYEHFYFAALCVTNE